MRGVLKRFIAPVVLLTSLVAYSCAGNICIAKKKQSFDLSRNSAYLAIDIEKDLNPDYVIADVRKGIVTNEDNYCLVERILNKSTKRIKIEDKPLDISKSIDNLLKEEGFEYQDYSTWQDYVLGRNLLSHGFATRKIDCLGYALLYQGISEKNKLKLNMINMPGHVSTRWNLEDNSYFNWDPTVARKCMDDAYISWKNISEDSINDCVYLKSLSKKEVIAHIIYNKCLVLKERNQLDKAIEGIDTAIDFFPKYSDAYNLRGIVWKMLGSFDNAIDDFDKAIELDENLGDSYYNRADVNLILNNMAEANRDYNILKTLDKELAERLEYIMKSQSLPQKQQSTPISLAF